MSRSVHTVRLLQWYFYSRSSEHATMNTRVLLFIEDFTETHFDAVFMAPNGTLSTFFLPFPSSEREKVSRWIFQVTSPMREVNSQSTMSASKDQWKVGWISFKMDRAAPRVTTSSASSSASCLFNLLPHPVKLRMKSIDYRFELLKELTS